MNNERNDFLLNTGDGLIPVDGVLGKYDVYYAPLYGQYRIRNYVHGTSIIESTYWFGVSNIRHAYWVKETGMAPPEFNNCHRCSLCGNYALRNHRFREELSDYCPHCGARMDGVKNGASKES